MEEIFQEDAAAGGEDCKNSKKEDDVDPSAGGLLLFTVLIRGATILLRLNQMKGSVKLRVSCSLSFSLFFSYLIIDNI
ncbi:unnamed protein product [Musa acuminata subsp. malaccensis]|uniref:(wild Malaysian banana) hypothetical protein n=1 Tax=Musa acuminata subsp. malaccensis TaxID=214687 RepID=A0A804J7B8_MUSAM|nr:unnamed protein product [Musa acuminata subsp. malaccensis]